MRLKVKFAFSSEFTMTDVAPRDQSETNMSAFDLGVYANQFLWKLDQAFVANSDHHRLAALGVIQRLRTIGSVFTEKKTNAKLEVFLDKISEYLPETLGRDRSEMLRDFQIESYNVDSDLSDGKRWYQYLGSIGQERENLRKVINNRTLQSAQQRVWFDWGVLIDSGRYPPDTGIFLYNFNPPQNRRRFTIPIPQSILTNDDEPEVPLFRTFEPGELPPQSEWWQELLHLCEELDVPCNPEEPDLSTTDSVVETVKQMIERARETIAPNAPAPLTTLSDNHQQAAPGSPNVGTARKDQEVTSPDGGEADPANGNSTEQGGEDASSRQPVTTTQVFVNPSGAVLPPTPAHPNVAGALGDNDWPKSGAASGDTKSGDSRPTTAQQLESSKVPSQVISQITRPAMEEHGSWEFDAGKVRFKRGQWNSMPRQSWAILRCLAKKTEPVSLRNLIDAAWNGSTSTMDGTIRTGISRLEQFQSWIAVS